LLMFVDLAAWCHVGDDVHIDSPWHQASLDQLGQKSLVTWRATAERHTGSIRT
jgi:hypothetical protein